MNRVGENRNRGHLVINRKGVRETERMHGSVIADCFGVRMPVANDVHRWLSSQDPGVCRPVAAAISTDD